MLLRVDYCLDSNVGLYCSEAALNAETGVVSQFKMPVGVKQIYRESIKFEYNGTIFDYDVGYQNNKKSSTFVFKVLSYEETKLFKILNAERMKKTLEGELSLNERKNDKVIKC